MEAIEHLPDGTSLVIHDFAWADYERLLNDLRDRPHLRVSYDEGKLEIMSPLPEHEDYARFIDDLVRAVADALGVELEKRGGATSKSRRLARGVEPDATRTLRLMSWSKSTSRTSRSPSSVSTQRWEFPKSGVMTRRTHNSTH
jgi:Uma2 family endonuclease